MRCAYDSYHRRGRGEADPGRLRQPPRRRQDRGHPLTDQEQDHLRVGLGCKLIKKGFHCQDENVEID